jgi:hypothetical protein
VSPAWQKLVALGAGFENAGDTAARQENWLFNCLHRNRATHYGEQYHFDTIRSIQDFRERVPVISYEDVEPYIQRMSDGDADVLFAGLPIAFERTGGSTGGSKLIPYSAHSLKDFQAALLPWLGNSIRQFGIMSGTAYFSISPATRQAEVSAGGTAIGLPDGAYLGADALAEFVQISAVPAWAGSLHDVAEWQLATLYWLLRRKDLALISVWSPSFMLTLLDALQGRREELAGLLQYGGVLSGHALSPDPVALARLARFTVGGDTRCLWPNLKLVSCWADASSQPFFAELSQRLSHAAFQGKGLLSTEGVVTVPDCAGRPVLAPDSGFFEFQSSNGELCLGHELIGGEQYEVVMTTSGGLYRYRTSDSVICEGLADDIPILRFSGRKGLISDIVGEKLDEGFVLSCLEDIPGFRMLVPVRTPGSGYALVVDDQYQHASTALISIVEARLFKNPQYAYARRIGQLGELSLYKAAHPLAKYVGRLVAAGARLGDLKVTALRAETDWLETFSGRVT